MLNSWLLFINSHWIMVWNKAVFCLEVLIYKRLLTWWHNYVIGHNKYLISTLSESTVPSDYSLHFCFHMSFMEIWKKNVSGCFFSEHCIERERENNDGVIIDTHLRCWQCCFIFSIQWRVNKLHGLSLQSTDGRPVLALVAASVSAILIPLVSAQYRVLVSV